MTAGIQITTRKRKALPTVRGVLWEGPSPIDGAPLVAVVTDHTQNKKISRTGRVPQIWILRSDMHPHGARLSGADSAVCGDCPFVANKGCYVNANPLGAIYRAYKRGSYKRVAVSDLAGRKVRVGAYGDPAFLPHALVEQIASVAAGWFGYTHQWRDPRFRWAREYLMASTETADGYAAAVADGWRPFHLSDPDALGAPTGAILCPAESRGVSCEDCGLCDGTRRGTRASVKPIYIPGHGSAAVLRRLRKTLAKL